MPSNRENAHRASTTTRKNFYLSHKPNVSVACSLQKILNKLGMISSSPRKFASLTLASSLSLSFAKKLHEFLINLLQAYPLLSCTART